MKKLFFAVAIFCVTNASGQSVPTENDHSSGWFWCENLFCLYPPHSPNENWATTYFFLDNDSRQAAMNQCTQTGGTVFLD